MQRIDNMIRDEHTINNENFVWAERYLKGILAEAPQNNGARRRLIRLYESRENRDSLAQGRYSEEGILIEPMDFELNFRLVTIRNERKELDRLIAFYEPLVKKYPKNYVIIEHLIDTYIKCRYFDKARDLINISESRSTFDLLRGDLELALGNENLAKKNWTTAANKYAADERALFAAAERFNKVCDYETAIALYKKKYEISAEPKTLDSLYALAFLYDKLGRTAEAIDMWRTIIKGLEQDYHITEGETLDWPKRELEKLVPIIRDLTA
jgi:tetratricopeptide (TPR) repeat protein